MRKIEVKQCGDCPYFKVQALAPPKCGAWRDRGSLCMLPDTRPPQVCPLRDGGLKVKLADGV